MIDKGHPWVTEDSFTKRFPQDAQLIVAGETQKKYILLHDPRHPHVKARFWAETTTVQKEIENFEKVLRERLEKSFEKRKKLGVEPHREHYYLSFAEADGLPGLFIRKLGGIVLFELYSHFWETRLALLAKLTADIIGEQDFWFQVRGSSQKPAQQLTKQKTVLKFVVKENNFSLNGILGTRYDCGVYTDMANIREQMKWDFKHKSLLNLYSYTGAFSAMALAGGAKLVSSVDLSAPYLEELEQNLILNKMDLKLHEKMCQSTKSALAKFIKDGRKFDFLICDPPSSSSDGQKQSSALKDYPLLIEQFAKILNPTGKALLFLNTHSVSWAKFKNAIEPTLKSQKFKITNEFHLSADCPTLRFFPEGDYIKCFEIEKI